MHINKGPDYVVVLWQDKHGINILPDDDPGIKVHRKDGQPGHGDVIEFLLFYRVAWWRRKNVKISFKGTKWEKILEGGATEIVLGKNRRDARVTIDEHAPLSDDPVHYRVALVGSSHTQGPCGPNGDPSMIIKGGGGGGGG